MLKCAVKDKIQLTINDQSYLIYRSKSTFECSDPLNFLEQVDVYPKVFWESKSCNKTLLALGSLLEFEKAPSFDASEESHSIKFFGMTSFPSKCEKKLNPWKQFKKTLFFLPKAYIEIKNNQQAFVTFYSFDDDLDIDLKQDNAASSNPSKAICQNQTFHPNYDEYTLNLEELFKLFKTTALEKVVFSRTSELTFDQSVSPYFLLKQLIEISSNSHFFGFFPEKDLGFVGASPETLYVRDKNTIQTHALAGTRARSQDKTLDQKFAKELMQSLKDRKEFEHVAVFIKKQLSTLSDALESSDIQILSSASAHHLNQNFSATLKDSITDQDLINALHPTPAMSGLPQNLAISAIDTLEPYNRGFYSAPLGWFSKDHAEVIVGIRSCLVNRDKAYLFSGGGIISDSIIKHEWEELNLKISPLVKLLC